MNTDQITHGDRLKPGLLTSETGPAEAGTPYLAGETIKLDDLSLQRNCAAYPEELREPFMWLGWFVREKCSGSPTTLCDRARELGIETDKTNWSKVLRGKWNRDKANNPLPTPIIALKKLLSYIDKLRESDRLSEMAGKIPFVMTSTAQDIFGFIDGKRSPERVNRFGVIVGPTGSQKTATLKEYCRRNNHGMCVWMETPENGSMKEFLLTLAGKYGRTDSYDNARRRVMQTLNRHKTIVIDNAQAAYDEKAQGKQRIFDFLRRVQDETECTVVLSVTPEFDRKITDRMLEGYFEQFEGRAGGKKGFLRLPNYAPEEDVLAIAEAFGLVDAEKHLDYLVAISRERGRIRRLFEDLQQAKINAEQEGKKKLTISYVQEVHDEL
jgi:DNA transposition AAA+ family ATPase